MKKKSLIMVLVMLLALTLPMQIFAEERKTRSVEGFVTRLYENFLGRNPDEKGLEAWTEALLTGKATGSKVVYGFVYSPEFINNPLSDTDYVSTMYLTILGRNPDEAGLNAWVSVLEKGCTRKKILEGFLNSQEMKALCSEMGVEPGDYHSGDIRDRNTHTTFFVSRLYEYCLGRKGDETGVVNWVAELVSGKTDAASMTRAFFWSKEFVAKRPSKEEFVTAVNKTILDRETKAEDFDRLTALVYKENYIVEAIKSPEFERLCNAYGLDRFSPNYDPNAWAILE